MSNVPGAFSPEWGRRVRSAINESAAYRSKGASWSDLLALEMSSDSTEPKIAVLDLHHGACLSVACGSDARPETAAFQLSASDENWRRVLDGSLEPMWGIMSGKLRLARGSVAALLPHGEAAKELVAAIATVPALFPGDVLHDTGCLPDEGSG